MNISIKHKIVFSLICGFLFAVLNSLTNYLFLDRDFSWISFALNFLFFGFIFGFGLLYFMKKLSQKLLNKIQIEVTKDEIINHEGPANLFRGMEGVGGKLLLTDQRLIFKSHKMNIQSGEVQLLLADIKETSPRKTAKLFQNGLRVLTNTGEHFDFVVYERSNWISKLNSSKHIP
jgi:hypothetical protein